MISSAEMKATTNRIGVLKIRDAELEGKIRELDMERVELAKQLQTKMIALEALLLAVVSTNRELKPKLNLCIEMR